MLKDEIIEEIHALREEYAKSFDYDLDAIFNDLRHKQNAHKQRVVKLPIHRKFNKSLEKIGKK
jgi:hypothetical protein